MKLITFTLLASALPLALVAGEQKTIGRPSMILAQAPLEEPPVRAVVSPGCRQSPKSGFSPVIP